MASTEQNESLVGQLIGVHLAMITLAALTVVGRIAVRLTLTNRGIKGDDITIIASLVLAISFVTVNLYRELTLFLSPKRNLLEVPS
jgi:hypothetical protein